MGIKVPSNLFQILSTCYRNIFPQVHIELGQVKDKAKTIPNQELKNQALASIESKTFHCEGGAIYATLANEKWKDGVKFIVAYQTISDYLDNLCDRSTSLDPEDFRLLHRSMQHAISPTREEPVNYYALRDDQDDDGYLQMLVDQCQDVIQKIEGYEIIYPYISRLANLYIDLQVHKHVRHDERLPRLTKWYDEENEHDDIAWYEFSAATGSTIGIFCLVSYALNGKLYGEKVMDAYFPYMQGLHILLDYFIDQKEDEIEGDLNFCHFYENDDVMLERLHYFIKESESHVIHLPDCDFHQLIRSGLVGLYLSDYKSDEISDGIKMRKELLQYAGFQAKVIFWNGRAYRKWKKRKKLDD